MSKTVDFLQVARLPDKGDNVAIATTELETADANTTDVPDVIVISAADIRIPLTKTSAKPESKARVFPFISAPEIVVTALVTL